MSGRSWLGYLVMMWVAAEIGDLQAQFLEEAQLKNLQRYEFGRDRTSWNGLEVKLRNPLQREREEAEKILTKVLMARESTADAKILACRGLRLVAGFEGVPTLISLIRDARLSAEACLALQEKPSDDINPALRDALPLVENSLKTQLLVTLGRRGDREAVNVIVTIAKGIMDEKIRKTAITALGQIGGKEALAALSGLSLGEAYKRERAFALLAAAGRSMDLKPGDHIAGLATLRKLAVSAPYETIRLGALYEWASQDAEQRVALCRQALTSRKDGLLEIAPRLFGLLEKDEKLALYGTFFDGLDGSAKILLVELWDPEYRESDKVRALSLDIELPEALRQAAVRAAARIHE